jgi:regulator of sirC expression with transglutaminase-like and TPR domain
MKSSESVLLNSERLPFPNLHELLGHNIRDSDRAAEILEEIRLNRLEREVASYAAGEEPDLEEGAFLLARLKYPEVRQENHRPLLDRMAGVLMERARGLSDPRVIIDATRHYLYGEEGFRGNSRNYHDPDNSFLNRVLERKTGIPISLAVVTLLVARRINLPFYGIGIPGHFLLQYGKNPDGVLIDPFNGGNVLDRDEITRSLVSRGIPVQSSFFDPVGSREILARMVRDLIAIYRDRQEVETVRRLSLLHALIAQGSSST